MEDVWVEGRVWRMWVRIHRRVILAPPPQEVVSPYDPMNRHLKVDKNISLRVFCRDRARGKGLVVRGGGEGGRGGEGESEGGGGGGRGRGLAGYVRVF